MSVIELRNIPGRCCPEPACHYLSWNEAECSECGKKCEGCVFFESALLRKKEAEEELGRYD